MSTPSGTLSTMVDIDAHAGFQCAQLLELLALLERRGGQGRQNGRAPRGDRHKGRCGDRAGRRRDGRSGAGEIERAQPSGRRPACRRPSPRSGCCAPPCRLISAASVPISTAGSASGSIAAAMSEGASVGRSPWTLTTMPAAPFQVCGLQRLENAVGPRDVIGAGHHGATAGLLHAGRDRLRIGCHDHRADTRSLRPAHDVDDHRLARNVGERLAGKPGRGHAGRDENRERRPSVCRGGARPAAKCDRGSAGYTGCQRRGKPAICAPPHAPGEPLRCNASSVGNPPVLSASLSRDAMNSFELNKILGAILGTCLGVLSINIAAGAIFAPVKPAKPGYDIACRSRSRGGEQPGEHEKQEPIEQLLAKADVGRGENSAKKCAACHTFDKGGKQPRRPQSVGRHRPSRRRRRRASTIPRR